MKQLHKLYNGELELSFDPDAKGHRYIANGVPVPGVTTIMQVLAKPALIGWAANLSTDRFLAVCNEVLKRKGVVDTKVLKEASELARKAHTERKEKAGDIGTIVHDFIQHYPLKKVLPKDEPAHSMCRQLAKWYDQNVARDLAIETPVMSRTYNYAGTPDRVVMTKNRQVVLLDFKTGKYIYKESFIQEGFYSHALREEFRFNLDDAWIVSIPKIEGAEVQVGKLSDKNLPISFIERAAIQTWHLYRSLTELKSEVK